jgi:uncharacterized protein (TIGR03435 family)
MRSGLLCLLLPLALGRAQGPAFEVASVKPTQHGHVDGVSISHDPEATSPGSFQAVNNSLAELIRWAYDVREYQLSGPQWLNDDSECFDVEARMPFGTPKAQLRLMLRTLLETRFHLALHRENRVLPIYELAAVKGGAKLQPPAPGAKTGISYEGKFWSEIRAGNTTMGAFAQMLASRLGRPVIDETGVQNHFAVKLEYRISDNDADRPSLFEALRESMGLTLRGARGPVEVLVIDAVDRMPAEN